MEKYLIELEEILNIKSPTGHTESIIKYVEDKFKEIGIPTQRTQKNALIATIQGHDDKEHITLSAHVDTLGAVVKEIKPNGRVRLSQIGGYAWTTIEGEYVTIETLDNQFYTGTVLHTMASTHVHGNETATNPRNDKTLEVRIDEKVSSTQDVIDLGINVGDFVHLDPRAQITAQGFIKSRHLDDKACVVTLFELARYFTENNLKPRHTTHFFLSNYEEVGHGASAAIPEKTSEFIAIDMAAMGSEQTSDEFSVTICTKDSSGPYDYELRKRLVKLAKENNIPYKLDVYPYYGSDGSAALRAGHDIRVALIGPGVDASHSYERTHKEAIEATTNLCIAYLTK